MSNPPVPIAAVVLNYRTPTETCQAVHALEASETAFGEIVVVDNGSGEGSEAMLQRRLPRATVVGTGANLGFSGGCNVGIRLALSHGAGAVLLVNSDAIVLPDTAGLMAETLRRPGVGIVGPAILDTASHQVESLGISYSRTTGRMRQREADRTTTGVPIPNEVDAVSGAVMLVARGVFERIGLFAEEYYFGFEDVDFCLRARRAGFRTVVTPSAHALHAGSTSIGPESPRRLYFAARNHLLLASRLEPRFLPYRTLRAGSIVALNLAHAIIRSAVPIIPGVQAVVRGTRDHLSGRYGSGR
jgi:GT2 family glycosyltransferase